MDMNSMKAQTFGVEIEMYHITRQKAASVIADLFGSTAVYEGTVYRTWTCTDEYGRTWKFERDASIVAPDDEKCELVTPILYYNDIERLQNVVRTLRRNGARSNPKHQCGVHIHIGADGHTAKSLRNLVNMMSRYEELLISAINVTEARQNWCKVVDANFLKELNKKKPETMQQLFDIWYVSQGCEYGRENHYNNSRYHMLNLHATATKGTIEFRLFQFDDWSPEYKGGLHAGKLKAYIQLCMAMSQRAKEISNSSPKKVQTENPRFAMRLWLVGLGLKGDEFKTCRKWMVDRLQGDTNHRNTQEV